VPGKPTPAVLNPARPFLISKRDVNEATSNARKLSPWLRDEESRPRIFRGIVIVQAERAGPEGVTAWGFLIEASVGNNGLSSWGLEKQMQGIL